MDTFSVLVRVTDSSFINTEYEHSPINITLDLYSKTNGTLISTIFSDTVEGTATFSSLNIISQDLYYYQASCSNCASTNSTTLNITTYVETIFLVPQTTDTSANLNISLGVSLLAYDGTPFTGSCSFSLTETSNSLNGNSLSLIKGSFESFSIWFNSTGTKTLTGSCAQLTVGDSILPAISKNLTLTIH